MTVLELIGLIAILWVIYDFIITPDKIDFTVEINGKTISDYHKTSSEDKTLSTSYLNFFIF